MITPDEAYRMAAAGNLPHLPLFEGARSGLYELTILSQPQIAWPALITKSLRPRVLLLGDDPDTAGDSLGPTAWVCARAAKRWARAVIIHGTGPHPDHYRTAGQATIWHRYVLLVECSSARIGEWQEFLDCKRTLVFRPPHGCVHPSGADRVVH